MLLVSAGISLLLGNQADAISIGMALGIVSAVAAIQEYRSEKGKLGDNNIVITKKLRQNIDQTQCCFCSNDQNPTDD